MAKKVVSEQQPDKEKQIDFLYDEYLRRINLQDSNYDTLILKAQTLLGFVFTITVAYFAAWSIQPSINSLIKLFVNPKGLTLLSLINYVNIFHITSIQFFGFWILLQWIARILAITFIFFTVRSTISALKPRSFENPGSPDIDIRNITYVRKKHIQIAGFRQAYLNNSTKYDTISEDLEKALHKFVIAIFFILLSFLL